MAITCPSCGRANDDDARFCVSCGAGLLPVCANCGAELAADAVFCKACGAAVAGVAPAAAAPEAAPEAAPVPDVVPEAAPVPDAPPAAAAPAAEPAVTQAMAAATQPMPAAEPPTETAPAGPPPPSSGTVAPTGTGGPPRKGPHPALIVAIALIVIAVLAGGAAAWFAFGRGDGGGGGDEGKKTPIPVASTSASPTESPESSPTPAPQSESYMAAAVGRRGDVLGTVAADGSVIELSTTIGPQIADITWSPDGRWIACVAGTWKRPKLYLVDVTQGNAVSQVRISTPSVVAIDSVAWLSSSELLVAGYTAVPKYQGEDAELLVYDPDSESVEPLTDSAGVALRGVEVSASSDGNRIAYIVFTDQKVDSYGSASGTERLKIFDRTTGEAVQLGSDKAMFDWGGRGFYRPLISPAGDAVICSSVGGDIGVGYKVLDASGTTLMSKPNLLYPAGYAWDPTGEKVVFTGHTTENGPARFFIFDKSAGGAPTILASYKKTIVQDLAWSPDGSMIAWSEWDKVNYRSGTLYLTSIDGGDADFVAEWAISPAWEPQQ